MMAKYMFGLLMVLVLSGVTLADPTVTVTVSSHATTGLSGYTTYVVNVDSDDNLDVTSVGMKVETSGAMVMNQVQQFDIDVIFDNGLWALLGLEGDQDSHFLFSSSGLTSVEVDEDATYLQAYFTGTDFLSANVMQVVLPDTDWASYEGSVVVDDNGQPFEIEISGTIGN